MPVPGVARSPLRRAYEVAIVGGGVQGLALAYELAARGMRDVVVLDAAWPGAGASGRNGELIRSMFASPEWIGLFDASLRKWRGLSAELGFNVLFTPAGYFCLAPDAAGFERLRAYCARQRAQGLAVRVVEPDDVRAVVPALNPALAYGGLLQDDAGFAHHDAVVWAYAGAASRLGAEIHPFTAVDAIRMDGERVVGVSTSRGDVAADVVVNAAGGQARRVAAFAGVDLPSHPLRLDAFVTESLHPFLRPAVALVPLLGYCHQTTRGEFVGGTEQRVMEPGERTRPSLRALRDACQKFVHAFPLLAGVRILRHWTGLVDLTPDIAPVLGRVPERRGLWLSTGWAYGFMGAPGAAALLADAITTGRIPAAMAPFGIERFRAGRPIAEEMLVVVPPGDAG
jgi:sarcosine oxidase subunit beta